jgi:hypothetical protein
LRYGLPAILAAKQGDYDDPIIMITKYESGERRRSP